VRTSFPVGIGACPECGSKLHFAGIEGCGTFECRPPQVTLYELEDGTADWSTQPGTYTWEIDNRRVRTGDCHSGFCKQYRHGVGDAQGWWCEDTRCVYAIMLRVLPAIDELDLRAMGLFEERQGQVAEAKRGMEATSSPVKRALGCAGTLPLIVASVLIAGVTLI